MKEVKSPLPLYPNWVHIAHLLLLAVLAAVALEYLRYRDKRLLRRVALHVNAAFAGRTDGARTAD